ncbi:metallopeptidase TldD-related protein [Streptomyces sp. NPDC057367]|uniref:metallopeptidase TldD-related protein n=1 Tax=Streptomyces sp. NPDC057367 TaxID=3346108 RepID=UPI00363CDD43
MSGTFQQSDEWQIEVRSIQGGNCGAAMTTVATPDGIRRARDTARALLQAAPVAWPEGAPRADTVRQSGPALGTCPDIEEVRAVADRAGAHGTDGDRPAVAVAHTVTSMVLTDSTGCNATQVLSEAQLNLRSGPAPGTLGAGLAAHPSALDIVSSTAEWAASRERTRRDRITVPSVDWVVLSPLATAQLLSHLANGFCRPGEGDGQPLPVGSEVGSAHVSIVDDGTPDGGPAGTCFDEEGVLTRRTSVVEHGSLRCLLSGRGPEATGNARRAGWRQAHTVTPSNFFLAPTGTGPVDLSRAGTGMYVEQVTGVRHRLVDLRSTSIQLSLHGAAFRSGRPIGRCQAVAAAPGQRWLGAITEVSGPVKFYRVNGIFGGAECVLEGLPVDSV